MRLLELELEFWKTALIINKADVEQICAQQSSQTMALIEYKLKDQNQIAFKQ